MRVDFDPRLGMIEKILNGTKTQTIRKRKHKLYSKLQLWATWRAMKKGLYCIECFTLQGNPPKNPVMGHKCKSCNYPVLQEHPRKLLETRCIGNRRIRLAKWEEQIHLPGIGVRINSGIAVDLQPTIYGSHPFIIWEKDDRIDPFAKEDGFDNNREFVNFFRKYITSDGWEDYYINRWEYQE